MRGRLAPAMIAYMPDPSPILVVDDDPKIVALVRTYLERERYPVVTAGDGRTALRLIDEENPRLVVLDLMIPELDGLAVIRAARERGEVPILILSARGAVGEELGVAGVGVLLCLYGMIGYAGLRTASKAKGAYAKLLAGGLTSLILCQALLNVYAVLGLAPLTGVPLPFISSGSTSLIVLLCAMGLLLNVAAGGSAHLRPVEGGRERAARGDRGGRHGRPRRAGDRGRGRAAG